MCKKVLPSVVTADLYFVSCPLPKFRIYYVLSKSKASVTNQKDRPHANSIKLCLTKLLQIDKGPLFKYVTKLDLKYFSFKKDKTITFYQDSRIRTKTTVM